MNAVLRAPALAAMLSIDNIDTFYGETQVLFDVSLKVAAGEVVALLGPNGAGKTTTLRSILGLTPPRQGSIAFDARDITRMPTHEIAKAGMGWVPDDRRIFPTLTVARNLAIARKQTRFRQWNEKECFEIFSALEYDRIKLLVDSKIQSGKFEFEEIGLQLSQLISTLTELMLQKSIEKNISLSTKIDKRIPNELIGDPTRLNQILLNLVGNAIKFTERGEVKIEVDLISEDESLVELRFSVIDTGIGISDEN